MSRRGIVYLVGAGPGAPDLLTLRAADLLGRADVVVHDRLVHPDVLARARAGATLVDVGKEGGGRQVDQAVIHRILIAHARRGQMVVRLKGGDPFVFGRGGEEALAFKRAGIAFEVVPGVTSGTAVPALAGIPVTHRDVSGAVTFATGKRRRGDPAWKQLAQAETLVLFMAGRSLGESAEALIAAGRAPSTPAAVIESGSWAEQRVVEGTLKTIAQRARLARIGSPALVVIGDVVALRRSIGSRAPLLQTPPTLDVREAGGVL